MQPTPKELSIVVFGIDGILNQMNKNNSRPSVMDFLKAVSGHDEKKQFIQGKVIQHGKNEVNKHGMINLPTNKSFNEMVNVINKILPVCILNKDGVMHHDLSKNEVKQSIINGFTAINQTTCNKAVLDSMENTMKDMVNYAFLDMPEMAKKLLDDAEQDYCQSVKMEIMETWLGNSTDAANDFNA